jgi:ribosome-binding protein aMBF1 (putative translation factor)
MSHQDWKPVIFRKQVVKTHTVLSKNINPLASKHVKLDNETESFSHAKISSDIKMKIQSARFAAKLSQKQLAQAINVKPSIIAQYESGQAIPDHQILNKIRRTLKCKL